MTEKQPAQPAEQAQKSRRVAMLSLQSGCLTVVVAGMGLLVGLWLDARLGTAPRWTLICLVLSIPLAFSGILWNIQKTLQHLRTDPNSAVETEAGEKQVKS